MMRLLYNELKIWKGKQFKKPLILQGARQTGKTYLLKDFAALEYNQYHYFNFEKSRDLKEIFKLNLDPKRIIESLSLYQNKQIHMESDLVIFDEIQSIPLALTSLKYFNENLPQLDLICAGSLLGLQLNSESFPVGKVDFMDLYPMNFQEFIYATAPKIIIDAYDKVLFDKFRAIDPVLHTKLLELFSEYIFTGGMPEAINTYKRTKNLGMLEQRIQVRSIQESILISYANDFAKHSGKINAGYITSVFENIPLQLSQVVDSSVKRYRFKDVIPGKKSYAELEGPISWLLKAGLIIKTGICNRIEEPLKAFTSPSIFKLYYFDIGLLSAQLDMPLSYRINMDKGITKGFLAENFVAQEFTSCSKNQLLSWSERNSEVEFIKSTSHLGIIPIEVKSSERTRAKSLKQYFQKYDPQLAVILSTKKYIQSDKLTYLPIYLASKMDDILESF